jgi:hypothetical protein
MPPFDDETRKAFHEIRGLLAQKSAQVDINTEQIALLRELLKHHIEVCDDNYATLNRMADMMEKIHASYVVSNMIRKIVLWFAPLVAVGVAAYKSWKGL